VGESEGRERGLGMTTRIIESTHDIDTLDKLLKNMTLPVTVTIVKGKKVSYEQHKLENLWHNEASNQLEDGSPGEKRAYAKLHFGVAIMHGEDEVFRNAWDRVLRGLTYEQKLEAMSLPLDFPVTRHMTTKQKASYLDKIFIYYTSLGVKLTTPIPQNEG
jgi:hypothetical protein